MIEKSNVERDLVSLHIPAMGGLDSINVFLQDYHEGQGQVTVVCYGQAWTAYFGAMGESDIRSFLLRIDEDYLVGKFLIQQFRLRAAENVRMERYLQRIVKRLKQFLSEEA